MRGGAGLAAGEERRAGRERAHVAAACVRGSWCGLGRGRKERERETLGWGKVGSGRSPRGGKRGKRGESWASGGPCGREGKGRLGWAKAAGLGCLLLFFFLSFFCTQTIQTIYLNPNKFEFKSYKLNTRKIMLQHECTNNLIL
jgi:hypothetical protein